MPAHVPALTCEADLLAAYFVQQLDGVRNAAYGLTDEQARLTPTVSTMSIAALVNHVTSAGASWLDRMDAAPEGPVSRHATTEQAAAAHAAEWAPTDDLSTLLANLDAFKQRATATIPTLDMDTPVPVPSDAPWWPKDVENWPMRWAILHLIEEVARHAGHADIIRESIDGATMYELLAGAEGWPETNWLKPWKPARNS